jgi:hypothetical protein
MSQSAVRMHRSKPSRPSSWTHVTKEQSKDTGMAMVLLLLLGYARFRREWLLVGALALQVVVMTVPGIFRRVAVLWLGLSHAMGWVTSKVLLTAIFYLLVTPIGVARKLMGKDPMRLRAFKRGTASAMLTRNHTFTAADIEKPY